MKYFLAAATAVLFFIYAHTAAPAMYFGDDGEVISAAATLGIGHPPGYPLYMLITKAQTLLPFGGTAFRANLGAAFLGVLVFLMFYFCGKLFLKVVFNRPDGGAAAFLAALVYALSRQIWFEASHSKGAIYLLMFLAVLISLYFILSYADTKKIKYFYASFYSMGFLIPIHNATSMFLIFAIPALIYISRGRIKKTTYFYAAIIFLLALVTPYLYLFIRMKASPVINWGNLQTYREVFGHIIRETYNYNQSKISSPAALLFRFGNYFSVYLENYWLLALFAAAGLYYIYRKSLFFSGYMAVFYAANLGALIYVINTSAGFPINDLSPLTLYASKSFYLSSDIIPELFSAAGVYGLIRFFNIKFTFDGRFAYGLIFLMPAFMIFSNYENCDKTGEYLACDHARNILSSIPAGSILFTGNDCPLFNIAYLTVVKKEFPRIKVYDSGGTMLSYELYLNMRHKWDRDEFAEIEENTIIANPGKVYDTSIKSFKTFKGDTNLYGILYKPGPAGYFYPGTVKLFDMYSTRCLYTQPDTDIFYSSIAASYIIAKARYAALSGDRPLAEKYLRLAAAMGVKSPGVFLNISLVYNLDLHDPESAVPYVESVIMDNPYDLNAYGLLAKLYMQFDAEKAVYVLKTMYPRLSNDRERQAAIQEINEITASIEKQKAQLNGGVK
jgi:hypothetical protein